MCWKCRLLTIGLMFNTTVSPVSTRAGQWNIKVMVVPTRVQYPVGTP